MRITREEAIEYLKGADVTVGRKSKTKTAEVLDMAIKALEQTRWIPVSERLPKALMDVLLCNEEGEIGIGEYIDFNDMFDVAGWDIFWAVAWMPLPEPYAHDINAGSRAESEE